MTISVGVGAGGGNPESKDNLDLTTWSFVQLNLFPTIRVY